MDEQNIKELIEKTLRLQETELDLSGHGLEELPREIGLLKNLKKLDLSENNLDTLPREIGELTSLEILYLSFNLNMRSLPLEITNLYSLQQLNFDDNNFGQFPFSFIKLTNLKSLYIEGNQIEYLPAEIGNLTNLQELDININMLTSLPVEFGNLSKLKTLDISRNYLTEIPEALFDVLNLEILYAGENYIKSISPKILRLKKLRFLNLGDSGVGLRYFGPTEYSNEISDLPIEITQIEKLETLDLTGNPLPVAPEILEKTDNPSAIFTAYFGNTPPALKRNLRAFLCHSSHDKNQVRKLYRKLSGECIDVWFDEESLIPGQDWEYEISKAIDNSDVIIVCLSKNSVSKEGFVQKEIRFALDKAEEKPEGVIFIIPVLLEECEVPERLRKRHWAKLYEENGYSSLLKALNVRAINLGLK